MLLHQRPKESFVCCSREKDFGGREYWQTHRGSKVEDISDGSGEDGASNNVKVNLGEELYQTIVLPPASKPVTINNSQESASQIIVAPPSEKYGGIRKTSESKRSDTRS